MFLYSFTFSSPSKKYIFIVNYSLSQFMTSIIIDYFAGSRVVNLYQFRQMQKQSQYRMPSNFGTVESGSDLHNSYPHTSILQTIEESDHLVNRTFYTPLTVYQYKEMCLKKLQTTYSKLTYMAYQREFEKIFQKLNIASMLQDHRASQPTQSTQSTSIMHKVTDKMNRMKQYTSEVETDELDEEMARRISLDTTIVYKDSRNARIGGGSTLLMRMATKQNESSINSLPQLARKHTNSQMKEGSLAVFQNLRRSLAPTLGAYSSIDLKPVKSNNGLTPYKPAFNPLNNSVDYGSFEVNSPPQIAQLQQLRPSASILSKYEEQTPLKESLLQFNHQSQPAKSTHTCIIISGKFFQLVCINLSTEVT